MDDIVAKSRRSIALNTDEISPHVKAQHAISTGLLSQVGYQIFWTQLNELLRKFERKIQDPRITLYKMESEQLTPLIEGDNQTSVLD